MAAVSGPHHCIGTARAVADRLIRHLDECCALKDGILTRDDLAAVHARFVASLASSNLAWVEDVFSGCMAAVMPSSLPLRRGETLEHLLCHRTEAAARRAFARQNSAGGEIWIAEFFVVLADQIGRRVSLGLEDRLFAAYARLAVQVGANLTMSDLVRDTDVSMLLCEAVLLLTAVDVSDERVAGLVEAVNRATESVPTAGGFVPVGAAEMIAFLAEMRAAFGLPSAAPVQACAPNSRDGTGLTPPDRFGAAAAPTPA